MSAQNNHHHRRSNHHHHRPNHHHRRPHHHHPTPHHKKTKLIYCSPHVLDLQEDDENLIFKNEITTFDDVSDIITRKSVGSSVFLPLSKAWKCVHQLFGHSMRGWEPRHQVLQGMCPTNTHASSAQESGCY
ncbi:hypothetical protein CRUP_034350 [Coryphaenoides rupestris]|nr:hypothetical protein CRUP_034350 [Coryphaenoides rupestris]